MQDIAFTLFGVAILLLIIGLLPPLAQRLKLPGMVLLAATGVGLGTLIEVLELNARWGSFNDMMQALGSFDMPADAFVFIFLPTLLFETALTINVRRLLDDIAPILLLAVVAVLVSTFMIGVVLHAVGNVSLIACLLLGSILATTDPSAVVGIFRDLGAPRRLTMLVEGESLLNDAAAIALFTLLLAILTGRGSRAIDDAVVTFLWGFTGGIIVGVLCARAICALIAPLRDVPLAEITLTVALAYLSFIIAEEYAHASGVVAVVAAALVVGSHGRTRISPDTWSGLIQVWRQLGFWASSMIILLASMRVPPILMEAHFRDITLLGATVVAALVARALVLFALLPILSALGAASRVSHRFKAVMLWGGLRGAISLALALAVTENPRVDAGTKQFVAVLATGFVLFTLFVNGTTLRWVSRLLGIDILPPAEAAMRNRAMALSLTTIRQEIQRIGTEYQIEPMLASRVGELYAQRMQQIERDPTADEALAKADRVGIGLVTLANHEDELYRHHYRQGVASRPIIELLTGRTSRLIEGVKVGGLEGYRQAAAGMLAYSRPFRLAMLLHRRYGIDRPLTRQLARRFEALLLSRMVLAEMEHFIDDRLIPLLGKTAAEALHNVVDARLESTRQALAALKLQYPEYAMALQQRYLARAALRLEQSQYRTMYAESLISQEILYDLTRDIVSRGVILERPPQLDLGLHLADLVARVPLFTGLDLTRLGDIAKQLRPRLAVPGELLVRKGDRGREMYFIASGEVDVHVVGLAQPVRLGNGDFFGELALMTFQRRVADVRAVGFCHLLVLAKTDFRRLLARDEALRDHISDIAAARLDPKPA
ncbi:MAG: cation:proton antiporter [Azospirillaceae bacterium]|nr:cation:proton antiporter [Azospirillaceae bacterium]